jgi:hypothetical protein
MRAGILVIVGVVIILAGFTVVYWPLAVVALGGLLVAAGLLIDFGDTE